MPLSSLWTLAPSETFEADQAARAAIFDKIAPTGNWKGAIDAVIDVADLEDCRQAAIWFTGGPIEVVDRLWDQKVRVQGRGYYHHVGA